MYGVSLAGYQDVLLANAGAQTYLRCKISGAIDFIFGRTAQAYFRDTTIEITAPANITASGKQAAGAGVYLFEKTKIVKAADAWANTTGNVFFGRPWGAYATVVFKDTDVRVGMNPRMWNPWHPGDERTDNSEFSTLDGRSIMLTELKVLFAEYNTYGPGVPVKPQRANYTTILTLEVSQLRYTHPRGLI
jgi:pectinesterase